VSKKDSAAAMQRAIDKAKVQRAREEQKLKQADKKAARLREQVRQIEVNAARHGVDLNTLPTKKQARADKAAAERTAAAAAAEHRSKSTAERMADDINSVPRYGPRYLTMRSDVRPRSADKMTGDIVLGLDDRYADPSRNTLPSGPFLRPTHEVMAGQHPGQSAQPQYRPPAQTRVVSPQATTRTPLHRPWGSAPGQLGGMKLKDPQRGGGR